MPNLSKIVTEQSVEENKMHLEAFIKRIRNDLHPKHASKHELVFGKNSNARSLVGYTVDVDKLGQAVVVRYLEPPWWSMYEKGRYILKPLQNPDSRVTVYLTGPKSNVWSLVVPRSLVVPSGMFRREGGFELWSSAEWDADLSTTVLCSAEGDKQKRYKYAQYRSILHGLGMSIWEIIACFLHPAFGCYCCMRDWCGVCRRPCIESNNSDSHHIQLRENNVLVRVDSHSISYKPAFGDEGGGARIWYWALNAFYFCLILDFVFRMDPFFFISSCFF